LTFDLARPLLARRTALPAFELRICPATRKCWRRFVSRCFGWRWT